MNSTDHNINNPMGGSTIELLRMIDANVTYTMVCVTQETYDMMSSHDPNTMYIISDSPDKRIYIGDTLIRSNNTTKKYFIGQEDVNRYIIYMNTKSGNFIESDYLVPICMYDNAQSAIDALSKFNKVGSHIKLDNDIYNIIISYIDKHLSTHEFIVSIISAYNFKEDPLLQQIIQFAISYGVHKCMKEFPSFFVTQLSRMRTTESRSLLVMYSNLYDLMVKYDFFKGKKYQLDVDTINDIDLSKEISDISQAVYKTFICR